MLKAKKHDGCDELCYDQSHYIQAIFMQQNLRFELVLGRFAGLKISEIKLKYATFKGSFYISCAKQMKK